MLTLPPVSVIIPSYNRADKLASTLVSVFSQTIPPVLVIVVDDGSTDGTPEVVGKFSAEYPSWRERLLYLRQENRGKSVALNEGLRHVTTEWVAYNDSDDLWRPEKLELQFHALGDFPECGACFTDAEFVGLSGPVRRAFETAKRSYPSRYGRIADGPGFIVNAPHGVFMQTVLLRKKVMDRIGGFDSRFRVSQDTDFLFQLARETPLCFVNEPLVDIDRSEGRSIGLTTEFGRSSRTRVVTLEKIFEKWLSVTGDSERTLRRRIRKLLSGVRNELANIHLADYEFSTARRCLLEAIQARFSTRLSAKYLLLVACPNRLRCWIVPYL